MADDMIGDASNQLNEAARPSSPPEKEKAPAAFLSLPIKLRNRIYHLFISRTECNSSGPHRKSKSNILAHTNRQIRSEYLTQLHATWPIYIPYSGYDSPPSIRQWLALLGPDRVPVCKKFTFSAGSQGNVTVILRGFLHGFGVHENEKITEPHWWVSKAGRQVIVSAEKREEPYWWMTSIVGRDLVLIRGAHREVVDVVARIVWKGVRVRKAGSVCLSVAVVRKIVDALG